MQANVPAEPLAIFEPPIKRRTRCRTVNGLQRLNKEVARRTRAAPLFPKEESLPRLVTAVIGEVDEDSASGKIYLTMKPINSTRKPNDSPSEIHKRSCDAGAHRVCSCTRQPRIGKLLDCDQQN